MDVKKRRIQYDALKDFTNDVLKNAGAGVSQADIVASAMTWSDLIGRSSHGVSRLDIHVKRIGNQVLNPLAEPTTLKSHRSVALVDGNEGFGHYIADFAMKKAIEMSAKTGISAVAVRNSNFLGCLAYYLNLAANQGMIGIAFSNSVPAVAPFGGKKPVFGTNPIGFSAPRRNGKHLFLDMATSTWSGSAVRAALQQGKTLPAGVAIDEEGTEVTHPRALEVFTLLPFGGAKGYGLNLFVEILAAVITGSGISKDVASLFNDMNRSGDNGHLMLALDISKFIEIGYYFTRIEHVIDAIKASNAEIEILYPGERRWTIKERNLSLGIPISNRTFTALEELSRRFQLPLPC